MGTVESVRPVQSFDPPAAECLEKLTQLAARALTASQRSLPRLYVIGAPKCGTSSAWWELQRTPCCVAGFDKEIEFLGEDLGYLPMFRRGKHIPGKMLATLWGTPSVQGRLGYRKFFPLKKSLDAVARDHGTSFTLDATPTLLYSKLAPTLIDEWVSEPRFVVMLREPASRALSDFRMWNPKARPKEFERAVEDELEGKVHDFNSMYVEQGLYSTYLPRWLDVFPRSSFMFTTLREFSQSPGEFVNAVLRLMDAPGVPHWEPDEPQNISGSTAALPSMSFMRALRDFYQPSLRELRELTGVDLIDPG